MRTDGEKIVALLTEILDRLPEPEDVTEERVIRDDHGGIITRTVDTAPDVDPDEERSYHDGYHDGVSVAESVARLTPCSCSAQRDRAEKAEAEVERLTRERDEARHHHEALRADVDEFQYKHREYPGTWELVVALGRDIERRQA